MCLQSNYRMQISLQFDDLSRGFDIKRSFSKICWDTQYMYTYASMHIIFKGTTHMVYVHIVRDKFLLSPARRSGI